jgi:hypothetical protein
MKNCRLDHVHDRKTCVPMPCSVCANPASYGKDFGLDPGMGVEWFCLTHWLSRNYAPAPRDHHWRGGGF